VFAAYLTKLGHEAHHVVRETPACCCRTSRATRACCNPVRRLRPTSVGRRHRGIPGFFDTRSGRPTFPRGDPTSPGDLAAALDAEVYENYTDVDGVFVSDPRIVEHPSK
jgi:aspartate kinase